MKMQSKQTNREKSNDILSLYQKTEFHLLKYQHHQHIEGNKWQIAIQDFRSEPNIPRLMTVSIIMDAQI